MNAGERLLFSALSVFRFSSWALTSVFYLTLTPDQVLSFRIGVVVSLLMAAAVTSRLYASARGQVKATALIIALETLGTAFLLLVTGGLSSVFVWYAINPILVAATTLSAFATASTLVGFVLLAGLFQRVTFHSLVQWLYDMSGWGALAPMLYALQRSSVPPAPAARDFIYLLLIFALISLAAQVLSHLLRVTRRQNERLLQQRRRLRRELEIRAELYGLIEQLNSSEDPTEIIHFAAASVRTLTGAATAAAWADLSVGTAEKDVGGSPHPLTVVGAPLSAELRDRLAKLSRRLTDIDDPGDALAHLAAGGTGGGADGDDVLIVPLLTTVACYGFVAVGGLPSGASADDFDQRGQCDQRQELDQVLEPIADLTAAALERCRLQEANQRLRVAAEKHRIAGELHDGVAQQLFNIATGAYALTARWLELRPAEIQEQLTLIADTARQAARELRVSIYGMQAGNVDGTQSGLPGMIGGYLRQLQLMHGIEVDYRVTGAADRLDGLIRPMMRAAVLRILREACGNALRHGGCRRLQVLLQAELDSCRLQVRDDGRGFKADATLRRQRQGMGLANMRRLVDSLGGELIIESSPGRGTVVDCRLPLPASSATVGLEVREVAT